MNQQERTQFILDITENLRNTLLARAWNMPDEWDGIEIRQLLVDVVESQFNFKQMPLSRKRAYNNAVLVRNLT